MWSASSQGAFGDEHLAGLDRRRLGGHAGDLVSLGHDGDDSETLAAQLLDQTRARAHVFSPALAAVSQLWPIMSPISRTGEAVFAPTVLIQSCTALATE